jgi:hypothetical protein
VIAAVGFDDALRESNAAAFRREFHGVADEIGEDLQDTVAIDVDHAEFTGD